MFYSQIMSDSRICHVPLKHSPLRDGCCRGQRSCFCALVCSAAGISALSANPFNFRPAVFVCADVQSPTLTSS